MNRDEKEWNDVLNSMNTFAGTIARTRAQGIQTDKLLKEKADKERQTAIDNRMATGLSRGESPEQLSKITSIPGEGWKQDYDSMNVGLKPGNRGYVPAEGFTRSSYAVGSAEVKKSLDEALKTKVSVFKNAEDAKFQDAYARISQMPIDQLLNSEEVKTGSFAKYGDNAGATSRAYAQRMLEYSQLPENAAKVTEQRRKVLTQKYEEHRSRMDIAGEYIKRGMFDDAKKVMRDVVDKSLLAYKTEETPDGKIKLKITTDGQDAVSDKAYTPQELYAELSKIGQKEFALNTWAAMEHSKQMNGKTALAPVVLVHPKTGKMVEAISRFDVLSHENKWYVTENGRETPYSDLGDLRKLGYVSVDTDKAIDDKTRRGLAIEGDILGNKNEKLRGNLINEQIKKAAAGGSDSGKINVNALKYFGKEFNKQVVSKMGGLGANIAEDDMGILKSGAPLDEKQKVVIENIGSSKGLVAALSPNESGGYNFHGFYTPDAAAEPENSGKNYVNENMAKLTALDNGKKKEGVGLKGLIVPMDREPGAEKLAQNIKKTVGLVDRAFSGDSGKSNQVKLDKLKKELVRHPNDESLRNRISQLEKAMGK